MKLQDLLLAIQKMGKPDLNGVGTDYNLGLGGDNNIGAYTEPGLTSIGGKLGPLGGTVGVDNGQPFGSANVNGQPLDFQTLLKLIGR